MIRRRATGFPLRSRRSARERPANDSADTRTRLLSAAKSLFGTRGYDRSATAAVAMAAGTSESQLIRYFGGKAGLLGTLVDRGFQPLTDELRALLDRGIDAPRALTELLDILTAILDRDADFAGILLSDAPRLRDGREVTVSSYVEFSWLLRRLVERGQTEGSFDRQLNAGAVAAALSGAIEAMLRERLLALQAGRRAFSAAEVRRVFDALLNGCARRDAAVERPEPVGVETG